MTYRYQISCDFCGKYEPDWDCVPPDWAIIAFSDSMKPQQHACAECWRKATAKLVVKLPTK